MALAGARGDALGGCNGETPTERMVPSAQITALNKVWRVVILVRSFSSVFLSFCVGLFFPP